MDLKPILTGVTQFSQNKLGLYQPQDKPADAALTGDSVALTVTGMIKDLLEKSAVQINRQQSILQELPPLVRDAASQIFQTNLPDTTNMSSGLASLLNCRRTASDRLHKLADTLVFAAVLRNFASDSQLQAAVKAFQKHFAELLPRLLDSNLTESGMIEQVRDSLHQLLGQDLRDAAAKQLTLKMPAYPDALSPAIREAAVKLAMPEIAQVWLLAEGDSSLWQGYSVDDLEHSAVLVRNLAVSINNAFHSSAEEHGQSILLSMQIPFAAEAAKPQPLHIHVFHEKQQAADDAEASSDTWVRLTFEPEFTGPVEAIFHLYGDDLLDIRIVFEDKQASRLFSAETASIREACREFPFMLKELSVL